MNLKSILATLRLLRGVCHPKFYELIDSHIEEIEFELTPIEDVDEVPEVKE